MNLFKKKIDKKKKRKSCSTNKWYVLHQSYKRYFHTLFTGNIKFRPSN